MDILYTVEEKYLQALEEARYGELPKALRLFQEIVAADASYARAYYQLGSLYHSEFKDYQTAGYYYKKCVDLEPLFPDVYEPYLKLLITLKMHKNMLQLATIALGIPGVCTANIEESLGCCAEDRQDLNTAISHYRNAAKLATNESDHTLFCSHLKRVTDKTKEKQRMVYDYQGS